MEPNEPELEPEPEPEWAARLRAHDTGVLPADLQAQIVAEGDGAVETLARIAHDPRYHDPVQPYEGWLVLQCGELLAEIATERAVDACLGLLTRVTGSRLLFELLLRHLNEKAGALVTDRALRLYHLETDWLVRSVCVRAAALSGRGRADVRDAVLERLRDDPVAACETATDFDDPTLAPILSRALDEHVLDTKPAPDANWEVFALNEALACLGVGLTPEQERKRRAAVRIRKSWERVAWPPGEVDDDDPALDDLPQVAVEATEGDPPAEAAEAYDRALRCALAAPLGWRYDPDAAPSLVFQVIWSRVGAGLSAGTLELVRAIRDADTRGLAFVGFAAGLVDRRDAAGLLQLAALVDEFPQGLRARHTLAEHLAQLGLFEACRRVALTSAEPEGFDGALYSAAMTHALAGRRDESLQVAARLEQPRPLDRLRAVIVRNLSWDGEFAAAEAMFGDFEDPDELWSSRLHVALERAEAGDPGPIRELLAADEADEKRERIRHCGGRALFAAGALDECLAFARAEDDHVLEAMCHAERGANARRGGRTAAAARAWDAMRRAVARSDESEVRDDARIWATVQLCWHGELGEARRMVHEMESAHGRVQALSDIAHALIGAGDLAGASAHLEESGDPRFDTLGDFVRAAVRSGEEALALRAADLALRPRHRGLMRRHMVEEQLAGDDLHAAWRTVQVAARRRPTETPLLLAEIGRHLAGTPSQARSVVERPAV